VENFIDTIDRPVTEEQVAILAKEEEAKAETETED